MPFAKIKKGVGRFRAHTIKIVLGIKTARSVSYLLTSAFVRVEEERPELVCSSTQRLNPCSSE